MEHKSNFDKWMHYTDGLASPTNYIQWGFYYLIAASLQRRVWCGANHKPIYPNMYITLVGKPGIGKGLIIKPISDILKYHKMLDPNAVKGEKEGKLSEVEQQMAHAIAESDFRLAQDEEGHYNAGKSKEFQSFDKPLLIPIAADATTYEALVKSMAKSMRRMNYTEFHEPSQKEIMQIYTHSSLCFCLEEIASLFRKRTEDLVNFLLQAYDCGDYTYDTKTQGKDRIRKCCLNFLGGTTPDFMQNTFDDKLLNQGFSSRTHYICAFKNRKNNFFIPDLTPEQRTIERELVEHVGKLTKLYGRAKTSPETDKYLQDWFDDYCKHPEKRANKSLKLEAYYARKNIHTVKLAMAIHFGESTELEIPLSAFQRAIEISHEEEKTMHLALQFETENPLAKATRNIVKYLTQAGKTTYKELAVEFWGEINREDLTTILNHLRDSEQIVVTSETDKLDPAKTVNYFNIKSS